MKEGDEALAQLRAERGVTLAEPTEAPIDTGPSATLSGEQRPGRPSPDPATDLPPERPTTTDRLKGLFGLGPKSEPTEPLAPTTERRPGRGRSSRVSVAELLSQGWASLGGLADRTPSTTRLADGTTPAGNCLRFQAPMAGEILDDTLKGTVIDRRVLQPVSRSVGKIDVVISMAAPPAIVYGIQAHPERAPALVPLLYAAISRSLPQYVEAMKKVNRKMEQRAAAAADLFIEGMPEGADPVQFIIDQMFGGMIRFDGAPVPQTVEVS